MDFLRKTLKFLKKSVKFQQNRSKFQKNQTFFKNKTFLKIESKLFLKNLGIFQTLF